MTIVGELDLAGEGAWDVCIVGTGPVGIALALECEKLGLRVLALEAGGEEASRFRWSNLAEISSRESHAPLHVTTRSGFGGTSWAWSGRCARFDDIDFVSRDYVPFSGWPLNHREIEPYYARAASILNCNLAEAIPKHDSWEGLDSISAATYLASSEQPQLALSYREHFRRSKNITLCLNSPVVDVQLAPTGERVEAVVVVQRGERHVVRAPHVVIAAGGLRSTQLLLAAQRQWPNHFGGPDGALGRYYMGHLTGCISSIKFNGSGEAEKFRGADGAGPHAASRRFTISDARQMSEKLLNIAFWPTMPSFYDPGHSDGTLSVAFLALAVPKIGEWLIGGTAYRAYMGPEPRHIGAHMRNVLRSPLSSVAGATRALWNRLMAMPSLGTLARHSGLGIYSLQYHAEAEPKHDSRVTLGESTDCLGLPRLKINLLFGERDASSVVRAHDVLDEALRGAGKARLDYLDPPEVRMQRVLEQASDGYHQLGTTRMGSDPKESVVDAQCRVHGVTNLYVASSSVFPTGGQANPTLLATALAVRLAKHLADRTQGAVTASLSSAKTA